MPLPDNDFDVTEVAVPWHVLTTAGHRVTFATERAGTRPAADSRLLTGVLLGKLGAAAEAQRFYRQLTTEDEFLHAISWADIIPADYGGLILPGGHAPGMRQYLSALVLQEKAGQFWALGRPVGAICHGTLVLARTLDPAPPATTPLRSSSRTATTSPRAGPATLTCSAGASSPCSLPDLFACRRQARW